MKFTISADTGYNIWQAMKLCGPHEDRDDFGRVRTRTHATEFSTLGRILKENGWLVHGTLLVVRGVRFDERFTIIHDELGVTVSHVAFPV